MIYDQSPRGCEFKSRVRLSGKPNSHLTRKCTQCYTRASGVEKNDNKTSKPNTLGILSSSESTQHTVDIKLTSNGFWIRRVDEIRTYFSHFAGRQCSWRDPISTQEYNIIWVLLDSPAVLRMWYYHNIILRTTASDRNECTVYRQSRRPNTIKYEHE